MGLFNGKDKNGNLRIQIVHVQGLPGIREKAQVYMTLDEENRSLKFVIAFDKRSPIVNLSIDKITKCGYIHEETIKESNGVKRAIVGNILFGSTGAIVGAVTAKDKKALSTYRCINYVSNGEEKSIILSSTADMNELKMFKKLNELTNCNSDDPKTYDL